MALRTSGRRLTNIGFIVMFVSALVFLFLNDTARNGALGIVVLAVVAIGILVLISGLGMYTFGRIIRRSAARFVGTLK